MSRARVGVVTIAHGRHGHLATQHRSLAAGDVRPTEYVVVAMDDDALGPAEVDGLRRDVVHLPAHAEGLPLAAARNRGVAEMKERGVTAVVLLDVDCAAGRTLVSAYADAVDAGPATVWSGPVTYLPPTPRGGWSVGVFEGLDDPHPGRPAPHPGEDWPNPDPRLFWSLSFALSVPGWDAVGGFDERYVGYGAEDTDFGMQVVERGLQHRWLGSARAYHQHHPVSDPPVEHVDDLLRNGGRFADRWGWWPMAGWFEALEATGQVVRDGAGWRRAAPST